MTTKTEENSGNLSIVIWHCSAGWGGGNLNKIMKGAGGLYPITHEERKRMEAHPSGHSFAADVFGSPSMAGINATQRQSTVWSQCGVVV